MKNITLILMILVCFTYQSQSQTLTAKFSADNCYSVYIGNNNSTTRKVLPADNRWGISNTNANHIFNATIVPKIAYSSGDYMYVIAWADGGGCQGLIGEFVGNQTIKTGQKGWQVYPTNMNFDPGGAPEKKLIDKMIAKANQTNGWQVPAVGPTNAQTKTVCKPYSRVAKVKGISDNANWIWHNTKRHNHPDAPFQAFNHQEFLIFRFPTKLVGGGKPDVPKPNQDNGSSRPQYDLCCPPIIQEDLTEMLELVGDLQSYKPFMLLTNEFKNRIQAYADYRAALDPCFTDFSVSYSIRKPVSQPNTFDFAENNILSSGTTVFRPGQNTTTAWGQEFLSDITLSPNKWYRLDMVFYGGPTSCGQWNPIEDGCHVDMIEFNLQTGQLRTSGNYKGKVGDFAKLKYSKGAKLNRSQLLKLQKSKF